MTWQALPRLATPETTLVEQHLASRFSAVDAYRYNSASIRVRIVDERFRGLSVMRRLSLVDPVLEDLPESIQGDLVFVLCIAPGEESDQRFEVFNHEFEVPSIADQNGEGT